MPSPLPRESAEKATTWLCAIPTSEASFPTMTLPCDHVFVHLLASVVLSDTLMDGKRDTGCSSGVDLLSDFTEWQYLSVSF